MITFQTKSGAVKEDAKSGETGAKLKTTNTVRKFRTKVYFAQDQIKSYDFQYEKLCFHLIRKVYKKRPSKTRIIFLDQCYNMTVSR